MRTKSLVLIFSLSVFMPLSVSAEGQRTGILGMGAASGNAPTGHQVTQGGIAADQLAAHNNALDLLMKAATDAGNVADVKNALQGGLNLALDYKTACSLSNALRTSQTFDLSNPDQMKILLRSQLTAAPGACEKLHFAAALEAVARKSRGGYGFIPPDAFRKDAPGDAAEYEAARERYRAAREILALIDANTPTADKAYYPLYLQILAAGSTLPPEIYLWSMQQYEKALPEIRRARSLKEPLRERWNKIGSAAYAAGGVVFSSLWDKSIVVDGNIPPNVDPDSMTWLFVLDRTSTFETRSAKREESYCRQLTQAARKNARPDVKALTAAMEYGVLPHKSDYSANPNWSAGVAITRIADLHGYNIATISTAYDRMAVSHAVGYFLEKAKTAGVLSIPYVYTNAPGYYRQDGKYNQPVETLLHRKVFIGGSGPIASVVFLRALLEAGANPNAMNPRGKTPLDIVLKYDDPKTLIKQAFLQKDLDTVQCPENYY